MGLLFLLFLQIFLDEKTELKQLTWNIYTELMQF